MDDLNNNQDNQEIKLDDNAHGGARKGAGRPTGSNNKPRIADYLTDEEKEKLVKHYTKEALTDNRVLTHLIEQIVGKATNNMDVKLTAEVVKGFIYDKPRDNADNKTTPEATPGVGEATG